MSGVESAGTSTKRLVMCTLTAQPCVFNVYEDQEVIGERDSKQDGIVQGSQESSKDRDFTVSERLYSKLIIIQMVNTRTIGILTI